MRSGFNSDVKVSEDTDRWAGRVTEVDILELDAAFDVWEDSALGRLRVNLWTVVEQLDDFVSGDMGFGNVRHERKDVSSLDTTKGDAL